MAELPIQQTFDLALRQHQAGRLAEAERLYRQILDEQPEHIDAMHYLGVVANQTGRNDIAVDLIRRAIALNPNLPEAYSNLGNALKDEGQFDEAIAACRQAIILRPNYADAHNNLANALVAKGQPDEAINACRQAIALNPNLAQAYNNLGNALRDTKQPDKAIHAYRQAIVIRPDFPEPHNNLGNALKDNGQLDEAITAFHQAIALRPTYVEAHSNMGVALHERGQLDEAIAAHRQSLRLNPDDVGAHWNIAIALLLCGDLEQGWLEHEWRLKISGMQPPRPLSQPWWSGQELKGRTLLLHAEQGLGDTIQFMRYAPLLAQRGAKVVLVVPPELKKIVQCVAGVSCILESGQPLPPFDFHCSMLSLPLAFKTTLQSIPAEVPYLFPDPKLLESWRQKLAASGAGLKVALAWAGNPTFKGDRRRSISLDRLAPLSQVRDVTFYSVQKGYAVGQADQPPKGLKLVNLSAELHDFADTAAAMCLMDLVITTDTSVAHLAGALGRPVWVMLQFMPDWRWLLDREDSPWYPTMRLFRQSSLGDWPGVISRVVEALECLVMKS